MRNLWAGKYCTCQSLVILAVPINSGYQSTFLELLKGAVFFCHDKSRVIIHPRPPAW